LIISRLLSDRDRVDMTPDELAENEEALHRFVLICGRRACCAPRN